MPKDWKPESETAKMVQAAGFHYDSDQDIIFSRMNAWQREFGYAYAYDFAAPVSISAVIDCEPIYFSYAKKHWMIELWKGQYGLETGAEIGVYRSKKKRPYLDKTLGKRPDGKKNSKFYDCANDDERLDLSFSLKRKGETLFERGPEKHWWLTGFKWGVLSRPEDLIMDLTIGFPNDDMRDKFITALKQTGYNDVSVNDKHVSFIFSEAKTIQPRKDPDCAVFIESAEEVNNSIVARYSALGLPDNDPNKIEGPVADEIATYFHGYNPGRMMKTLNGIFSKAGKKHKIAISDVFDPDFLYVKGIGAKIKSLFKRKK